MWCTSATSPSRGEGPLAGAAGDLWGWSIAVAHVVEAGMEGVLDWRTMEGMERGTVARGLSPRGQRHVKTGEVASGPQPLVVGGIGWGGAGDA